MAKKEMDKKVSGEDVGEFVSRAEEFIETNKKNITYGIITLAVVIGAFVAWQHVYMAPKTKNAEIAIFKGEHYFMRDSFNLALYGNGFDYDGFEYIIEQYGGTKSGNLAKAYAGICYFKLGDMDNAIKYLKAFKTKEDNIAPAIIGLIGDCYIESGDIPQGISYFEKAASKANNDLLSPVYLKKAGIAYEFLKDYKNAIKSYTAIKDKHAASMEAMDIDKYITRAQILSEK